MDKERKSHVDFQNNFRLPSDEYKCVNSECAVSHRFATMEELQVHSAGCCNRLAQLPEPADSAYGTETADDSSDTDWTYDTAESPECNQGSRKRRISCDPTCASSLPPKKSRKTRTAEDGVQPCPEPDLYPRSDQIVKCVNSAWGCPKAGRYTQLLYHQHICTYVPATTKHNAVKERKEYHVRGYLALKLSSNNSMVTFNNSFLRDLNIQFFFCNLKSGLVVQAFSGWTSNANVKFKLKFTSENAKFTLRGRIDGKKHFIKEFHNETILKYKMCLMCPDPSTLA